jgi:capsular polysaccharide transport system permease protein
MRRRHWGLVASFVLIMLAPLVTVGFYLFKVAQDQYASTTGFIVRQEEGRTATDLLGGLAQFGGVAGGTGDSDILYEFILSQALVARIDNRLDLVGHYAAHHADDPVFALSPDAAIEDLLAFWQRMVRLSYDQSTGLIELRVLAFSPDMAQGIARNILSESQILVNDLNATARADTIRLADADLVAAVEHLRAAREALTGFRIRTQIVDPESDLQGRMGVLNNLQQQLAEALIEFDLLAENTNNASDARLVQAQNRIAVIQVRIMEERATFTLQNVGSGQQDYPTLMAEYEGLVVDREFAEESYRAARTALDIARANANRQSRYLAAYIQPTLPQTAEFPRRTIILALIGLFLFMTWATLALVYYSIRDRQ